MTTAVSVARHLGIVNDTTATIRGAPIPSNLKLSVSSDGNREQVHDLCSFCVASIWLQNAVASLHQLLVWILFLAFKFDQLPEKQKLLCA